MRATLWVAGLLLLLSSATGCGAKLIAPELPGERYSLAVVAFDGPSFPKALTRLERSSPHLAPAPRIGQSLQARFLSDYASKRDAFREEARAAGAPVPADLKPVTLRPLRWTQGAVLLNPDRRLPGDLIQELSATSKADVLLLGQAFFLYGDWVGTTSTPQKVGFGLAFQWTAYEMATGIPLGQGLSIKNAQYTAEVRLPESPADLATSLDEEVEELRQGLEDQILEDLLERFLYRVDAR